MPKKGVGGRKERGFFTNLMQEFSFDDEVLSNNFIAQVLFYVEEDIAKIIKL